MVSTASLATISDFPGFQFLQQPREGKSLLVLDIDKTIFHLEANLDGFPDCAPRPYLHEFLGHVYQNYDVALWSSTKMRIICKKVNQLDLLRQKNYEISFFVDHKVLVPVGLPHDENFSWAKPLSSIWNLLPQYNSTNTVMCDDDEDNFYYNPNNGIVVMPYDYKERGTDQELIHLTKYLHYLFHSCGDYSEDGHIDWRNHHSILV